MRRPEMLAQACDLMIAQRGFEKGKIDKPPISRRSAVILPWNSIFDILNFGVYKLRAMGYMIQDSVVLLRSAALNSRWHLAP